MFSIYGGYMGKTLLVNIANREAREYPWTDRARELFLGGKIMAAKILYDNLTVETTPFSKDNMLVITTGPLTGTGAPCSSRFNISTLSPLTGLITSSNCGGDFGLMLKKAGYDGLIITGKAEQPLWLEIESNHVKFHDATDLWGQLTGKTQQLLERKVKKSGKLVIGPAGENLVRYASIFSGERTAGRAGVGAIMGWKKLKAVVVRGRERASPANANMMKKVYKKWIKRLQQHSLTGNQLPRLGTAGLLSSMNAHKILATRNFKYGQYKDFEKVSGEYLAEKYLIKNKGCTSCPIRCGRVVKVNGQEVKGPELETIGLLGPNIENNSLKQILQWNVLLDDLGMDSISTGGSIAFAMELHEKGIWKTGLQFGKTDHLADIFKDIAYREGIGDLLAEGTKRLAEKFGGKNFAMHSKGMELAAYEPRGAVGQGLGYAVSNRGGCHLNAGYLVLLEGLSFDIDPFTTKAKAALVTIFQNVMEATSAAGSCIFSLYSMFPDLIISKPNSKLTRLVNNLLPRMGWLVNIINKYPTKIVPFDLPNVPLTRAIKSVTGLKMNFGKLLEIGARGYTLERLFNVKRGLTALADYLPHRLTNVSQPSAKPETVVPLAKMKKEYYKIRGWDRLGRPTNRTLKKLNLLGVSK